MEKKKKLGEVIHTSHSSTQEAEADRFLEFEASLPGLHKENKLHSLVDIESKDFFSV